MKIAIINYSFRCSTQGLEKYLKEKDVKVVKECSLVELEQNHKGKEFDFLLIHPGIDRQRETFESMARHYPSIPYAILTFNIDDYIIGSVPVFSADSKKFSLIYGFIQEKILSKTL